MRRHHSLRASDADRDAVVAQLRDAAGEGRLEPEEFEQRVDRALRARTYGDLAELLADLPNDGGVLLRRAGRGTNPGRPAVLGAGLLVAVTVAVTLVAVVVVLVLAAAAAWIAILLFWVVCCGLRRRLVWRPAGRRSVSAGRAHRTRPAGFL